jgi:hypothetical protein
MRRMAPFGLFRHSAARAKFAGTEESMPEANETARAPNIIKNTLGDLSEPPSEPQIAFTSMDGGVLGIGVKTRTRTGDLLNQIQSRERGSESPTRLRD